ncbi:hypothetical protein [Glycomyces terrestris]|uniref:Uncharacterized protein n=1 Tax=Glycomyces terrestris TaxID=2493553 RepID=A0A426V0C7_9ACTN|nr:hypothetical protein [Glycomyces terrestris]RRS00310.1 hypothetical protein EIW28_06925 [Glycomyces terrestris]
MRERRVGRRPLPARLVAGTAGVLVLATAASPVYAQDEESGGGEVLCNLHDPRNQYPAGIVAADGGDGWYIVSAADGQDQTLSIERVGEDCNPRGDDEVFIDHQPRDPQALALDHEGGSYLWVGDTGDATNRDWLTLNQIDLDDFSNNAVWRYVFPAEAHEVEAFLLLPGKKPLFVSADEGEAVLFSPPGDNQEEDTPLEQVGTVALPEGGSVSGAALNADGSKVALRTENAVYEWTVEGGDVVAALGGAPVTTPVADAGTAEGLAYDADGNFITLASDDNDGSFGTVTRYAPAAPAAEEDAGGGEEEAAPEPEDDASFVDWVLGLGFGTIVKILAAIAILGMAVMVFGIIIIRKYRKENAEHDDEDGGDRPRRGRREAGHAREESDFGRRDFLADDDPVDLGLDAGHPDPDLGQVARGNVCGAGGPARPEPSGNVYGGPARQEPGGNVYGASPARPEPTGNVYGASPARPEPSGNVYGGGPRREQPPAGGVYGGREEPQYGAFEGGGHGSVYDNAGPGQSFGAGRPEPSGNVYGASPARPEPSGNVYGAGGGAPRPQQQGSVYGAGNAERTPDADDGYWGPPEGGTTYGRNR